MAIGYLSTLIIGYGGTCSIAGLYFAEVSNFPMHLRSIIKNFNLRYTNSY